MEYIVIFLLFLASTFLAYKIIGLKVSLWHKVLYNISFLFVSAVLMFLTRIQELTLLIYILILLLTLLGILMRLAVPTVLNCIGQFLAKITKLPYEHQNYEQLMQDGHKMFFCVLLFTSVKVLLYIALFMSAVKII